MSEETETENLQTQETPAEETPTSLVKGDNQQVEKEKPAEEVSAEFVPLTAEDITFAEELNVTDETRDDFLGIVNDQEMSPKDRAQALINLQEKVAREASEAGSRAFADQQKTWQDEVKNDEKIGKGNFQKTLSEVNKLVEQYGSDELIQMMAATGAGNNIHMIRFLHGVAQKLVEPGPVTGSPASASGDRASRMFPSMKG